MIILTSSNLNFLNYIKIIKFLTVKFKFNIISLSWKNKINNKEEDHREQVGYEEDRK